MDFCPRHRATLCQNSEHASNVEGRKEAEGERQRTVQIAKYQGMGRQKENWRKGGRKKTGERGYRYIASF